MNVEHGPQGEAQAAAESAGAMFELPPCYRAQRVVAYAKDICGFQAASVIFVVQVCVSTVYRPLSSVIGCQQR